ncbi:hypothetical protein NECID01_1745 [Nematocida sp. AWRm77]|nr:hypothetical protein NECID01_1745 [Nematocida sp. AWRm77]
MSETVYDTAQVGVRGGRDAPALIEAQWGTERVLVSPERAKPSGESETEEKFCRICYSFEDPFGSCTELISPCGCKGTVKYVHKYCLRTWRFKGKMVKDIKVCEQCFCEYVVEDERKASVVIVCVSTVSIILSFLLAINIFITSTADTLSFISQDLASIVYGDRINTVSFEKPIILCNMDRAAAEKQRASTSESEYAVHKVVCPDGKEHYASVKKRGMYALKNSYLLDTQEHIVFPTVTALSLIYALSVEKTSLLLVNLLLSLWRLLSFGKVCDWAIYACVVLYTYTRMFFWLYVYIDSYCMYMANIY